MSNIRVNPARATSESICTPPRLSAHVPLPPTRTPAARVRPARGPRYPWAWTRAAREGQGRDSDGRQARGRSYEVEAELQGTPRAGTGVTAWADLEVDG